MLTLESSTHRFPADKGARHMEVLSVSLWTQICDVEAPGTVDRAWLCSTAASRRPEPLPTRHTRFVANSSLVLPFSPDVTECGSISAAFLEDFIMLLKGNIGNIFLVLRLSFTQF